MDGLFVPLLIGCIVAVASALGVILARRPVYAAIFLLIHSLSLAALFALLSATMIAVGQIIIYSGAIVVLFLFVVTLLPSGGTEHAIDGGRIATACIACAVILIALGASLAAGALPQAPPDGQIDLSPNAVGLSLFSTVVVAFELTAPLLLVAIIGAVVIWRRHEPRPRTATPVKISERREVVLHR